MLEKSDRTLVTHVTETIERDFLGLVEMEKLMGDENITNSSLLKKILIEYINIKRTEYLLLTGVFKQNDRNGEN